MNSLTEKIDTSRLIGLNLEAVELLGNKDGFVSSPWYKELLNSTGYFFEWENYWLALLDLIAEVDEETLEALKLAWQQGEL